MASKVPIVRQIAWSSLFTQILLLGFFIYIYYLLDIEFPFVFGALTYLILSYGLRNLSTGSHQKGMKLVKQGNFTDAIPYFEKSVDYFSKNAWVDKYRFLTMLSSSKMSYREMGLCNIAFCHSQTGNGIEAKKFYQLVLEDYPENILATSALNLFNSLENETK
jgi:tetratricopeptide (TPR) repeat protein